MVSIIVYGTESTLPIKVLEICFLEAVNVKVFIAVNRIIFSAGSGSFLRLSSECFWPGCWFLELVNNQVRTNIYLPFFNSCVSKIQHTVEHWQ